MRTVLPLLLTLLFMPNAAAALEHVRDVVEVQCSLEKSSPPNLRLDVTGLVPSSGWSDVQLLRRVYVQPPPDGIWEYDLVAKRPTGIVLWVISEVKASHSWTRFPEADVEGVRVYGVGRGVQTVSLADCLSAPVAKRGVAPAEACGGIDGRACRGGRWCDLDPGYCGAVDLQGVCVDKPGQCTTQYWPVCGCNGVTYSNDCERRKAKVQQDHVGACRKPAPEQP